LKFPLLPSSMNLGKSLTLLRLFIPLQKEDDNFCLSRQGYINQWLLSGRHLAWHRKAFGKCHCCHCHSGNSMNSFTPMERTEAMFISTCRFKTKTTVALKNSNNNTHTHS
jgi:hypothetical protein